MAQSQLNSKAVYQNLDRKSGSDFGIFDRRLLPKEALSFSLRTEY